MSTLIELAGDVRNNIDEALKGNDDITQELIFREINRGYVKVANDALVFPRKATLYTVAGQALYDLPPDIFAVERVVYNTGPYPLFATTERGLGSGVSRSFDSDAPGTPTHVAMHGTKKIRLYKAPTTSGVPFYVYGYAQPTPAYMLQRRIHFINGQAATIAVGDALKGWVGVTQFGEGTVARVNLTGGQWAAGTASGWIYFAAGTVTGSWAANAEIRRQDQGSTETVVGLCTGPDEIEEDVVTTLVNDTDEPQFHSGFHEMLSDFATSRICRMKKATSPGAVARAEAAEASYAWRMRNLQGFDIKRMGLGGIEITESKG